MFKKSLITDPFVAGVRAFKDYVILPHETPQAHLPFVHHAAREAGESVAQAQEYSFMRITLLKFRRLFFFTLLATCLPNLTFAQDCVPLTGPAPFSFALELAYENYGKACEQRFPEYKNQITALYSDWKRAAAKHVDIGRCHYEQTVAQRPVELRDAIAAADEVMKNGQLEEIKNGATDKAWSPCNWQLRMLKYKPNQ